MNVTAYTMSSCGPSRMLKASFRKEGIKYTEVDIEASAKEAMEAGIQATPTIVITLPSGLVTRIVGFDPDVLKRIKENKYGRSTR